MPPGGWNPRPTVSPKATATSPGPLSHMIPRSVPSTCHRLSVRFTELAPVCLATSRTCTTRGAAGAASRGAASVGGVTGAGGGGTSPGSGLGPGSAK
ncbi:Uncharacterised protein [Mycobacteroides abscessus subsp. abscessus]|nr:Uncharacterised protein [Mycobacteroides abscessus subsp. abscessus]